MNLGSASSIHGLIPLSIFIDISSTAENVIRINSFHWFAKLIKRPSMKACHHELGL